jgi:hypothetical protein
MHTAPVATEEVLYKQKYPRSCRVEVIPLASGEVMVIVKKKAAEYKPLDKLTSHNQ